MDIVLSYSRLRMRLHTFAFGPSYSDLKVRDGHRNDAGFSAKHYSGVSSLMARMMCSHARRLLLSNNRELAVAASEPGNLCRSGVLPPWPNVEGESLASGKILDSQDSTVAGQGHMSRPRLGYTCLRAHVELPCDFISR